MQLTTILAGAALATLTLVGTARAEVQFFPGPSGNVGDVNILFQGPEAGPSITGQVDHSGRFVMFDSPTLQGLDQQAEGQADIFCQTGCVDNSGIKRDFNSQLSSIEMIAGQDINTGSMTAWTDVAFNLNNGVGTALITVHDNLGNTFNFPLMNGENKGLLEVVAGSNEFITDVSFTNANPGQPFGFDDFKQPRVSGTCDLVAPTSCIPVVIPTPEPASLALLATGVLGVGLLARRRRN